MDAKKTFYLKDTSDTELKKVFIQRMQSSNGQRQRRRTVRRKLVSPQGRQSDFESAFEVRRNRKCFACFGSLRNEGSPL